MFGNRSKLLDARCPIDFSHPLNRGLIGEWAVVPLSGWNGAARIVDLTRGVHPPANIPLNGSYQWQGFAPIGGYGSLRFDGSTAYGDVAYTGISNLPLSMTAWARFDSGSAFGNNVETVMYLGTHNNTTGFDLRLRGDQSRMQFIFVDQGTGFSTGTPVYAPVANTWYHMVGVLNSPTDIIKLYVNGILYATFNLSGQGAGFHGAPTFLTLGAENGGSGFGNFLLGNANGWQIYNRVLSDSEIMNLYQEAVAGNPNRWRWLKPAIFTTTVAPFAPWRPVIVAQEQWYSEDW
jgi:hypothetical protein